MIMRKRRLSSCQSVQFGCPSDVLHQPRMYIESYAERCLQLLREHSKVTARIQVRDIFGNAPRRQAAVALRFQKGRATEPHQKPWPQLGTDRSPAAVHLLSRGGCRCASAMDADSDMKPIAALQQRFKPLETKEPAASRPRCRGDHPGQGRRLWWSAVPTDRLGLQGSGRAKGRFWQQILASGAAVFCETLARRICTGVAPSPGRRPNGRLPGWRSGPRRNETDAQLRRYQIFYMASSIAWSGVSVRRTSARRCMLRRGAPAARVQLSRTATLPSTNRVDPKLAPTRV